MKDIPILYQGRNNPFIAMRSEIDSILNNFNRLINPVSASTPQAFEGANIFPSIDLVEDNECLKVEVEMPGMGEEDVKVSLDNNLLTIKGEKKTSKKDEGKNYLSREISYGCYERLISLPDYVDASKAKATFKKGMLWVTIPKKTEHVNQRREVKVEKATS